MSIFATANIMVFFLSSRTNYRKMTFMSLFVSEWRVVSGAFFTVRFVGANLADAPHGR